jgi:hypothetical protein
MGGSLMWPRSSRQRRFLSVMCMLVPLSLIGCGISRDSGKALGQAGQLAATTIDSQAKAAGRVVEMLPEIHSVDGVLKCRHHAAANRNQCIAKARKEADEYRAAYRTIREVTNKRAAAAELLAKAYGSFVALSAYDAAGETETAIKTAFASLNDLAVAAGALPGAGPVLPPIVATFSSTASGVGGVIAGLRQSRLMLDASRDLHNATDLLIRALMAEGRVEVWTDLLIALNREKTTLIATASSSGMLLPSSVLKPLFQEVAPGLELVATPAAGDMYILREAAASSVIQRARVENERIAESYAAAITALEKLSDEHKKLEADQSLDIAGILAWVDRLQSLLKKLPN